jgi:hypothetical protein
MLSPSAPGRSMTEVSRNRAGGNGRTMRPRTPSRSASTSAVRSAPQAAEQTIATVCSARSNSFSR